MTLKAFLVLDRCVDLVTKVVAGGPFKVSNPRLQVSELPGKTRVVVRCCCLSSSFSLVFVDSAVFGAVLKVDCTLLGLNFEVKDVSL